MPPPLRSVRNRAYSPATVSKYTVPSGVYRRPPTARQQQYAPTYASCSAAACVRRIYARVACGRGAGRWWSSDSAWNTQQQPPVAPLTRVVPFPRCAQCAQHAHAAGQRLQPPSGAPVEGRRRRRGTRASNRQGGAGTGPAWRTRQPVSVQQPKYRDGLKRQYAATNEGKTETPRWKPIQPYERQPRQATRAAARGYTVCPAGAAPRNTG